jgi:hypothetical protein
VGRDSAAVLVPPFPVDSATCADLAAALASAIREHDRVLVALREAINACVCSLRDDQAMQPETVVITMKALLRHSVKTDAESRTKDLAVVDRWMEGMVTWCIEDYYRPR